MVAKQGVEEKEVQEHEEAVNQAVEEAKVKLG